MRLEQFSLVYLSRPKSRKSKDHPLESAAVINRMQAGFNGEKC
jgi:hypothetical protein